jgi:hypothetical protein
VLGALESVASAADVDGVAAAPRQGSAPSLEGFAFSGPSLVGGDPAVPETTESFRRVGIYGELGIAFRSSYFLDPFFSVGYWTLASGDTELPDGVWGEGGTLSQRLDTWHLSPGVTADFFRLRLRLGLGLLVVVQRYGFRGDDTVTTQVPIAGQLGLGFNLYDSRSVRLDVEGKFVHAAGAEISFGVLGATLRGDLVTFH